MMVSASLFFASLVGLSLLFTIKAVEVRRGTRFFPRLRASADTLALAIKGGIVDARQIIARVPPLFIYISRFVLHELALGAAKIARLIELQSHRVADLVSHKRSFERRPGRGGEPRSEFLTKVSERPDASEDGKVEL